MLQRRRISYRLSVSGKKAQRNVMGRGAMAIEYIYSRSLQDITRSIIRVKGVGR